MKKILFFMMGLIGLSVASCAGDKSTNAVTTDTDSITVVDSVAQVDSVSTSTDSVKVVAE